MRDIEAVVKEIGEAYDKGGPSHAQFLIDKLLSENPFERHSLYYWLPGVLPYNGISTLQICVRNDDPVINIPSHRMTNMYGKEQAAAMLYYAIHFNYKFGYWPTLSDVIESGTVAENKFLYCLEEMICEGLTGVASPEKHGLSGSLWKIETETTFFDQRLSLIGDFYPAARLTISVPIKSSKKTFIYMMKDGHSGCIKIGRSKDPKVRERTLQSEKPTIEMMGYWPGTYADEKRLHKMYAHKNVRGEWFRLSKADIRTVRTYCETMNK